MLFAASGAIFGSRVAPLQRQLLAMAKDGLASGSFDYARYREQAIRWEAW